MSADLNPSNLPELPSGPRPTIPALAPAARDDLSPTPVTPHDSDGGAPEPVDLSPTPVTPHDPDDGAPEPVDLSPTPSTPHDSGDEAGGTPLPDQPPGMDWDLAPGTVYPVMKPVAGGQPGATLGLAREAPKTLGRKTGCPSGDVVVITCIDGELTSVVIYNGAENPVALKGKVKKGKSVKHPGCFTHWHVDAPPGSAWYSAAGQMDGVPFLFQ